MQIKKYQEECLRTTPPLGENIYPTLCNFSLGLAGECGEVVDSIKKVVFQMHELDKDKLTEELGDVLWYFVNLSNVLNIDLDDIMNTNLEKLRKRYPDGFDSNRSINRGSINE